MINQVCRGLAHQSKAYAPTGGNLLTLAGQLLNIGTGACLISYGLKEILLDSHPKRFYLTPRPDSCPAVRKTTEAVNWFLLMIRNQPTSNGDRARFTLHGLLMIGTGAAGSAAGAIRLGVSSAATALPLLDFATGGLFILGNIVYMEYNIQKFIDASKQFRHSDRNRTILILRQVAASIGIVSNISYIGASVTSLTKAPLYYPVSLGIIGLVTGSTRILLESCISYKVAFGATEKNK